MLYVYCQLVNTKTQDGKQTLMHYLVECIEKRFPDVMDFANELIHVEKAARGRWLCRINFTSNSIQKRFLKIFFVLFLLFILKCYPFLLMLMVGQCWY